MSKTKRDRACYELPPLVRECVDKLTDENALGGKGKWIIVSAAMIAFCDLSMARRQDLISKVQRAKLINDFSDLFK